MVSTSEVSEKNDFLKHFESFLDYYKTFPPFELQFRCGSYFEMARGALIFLTRAP